MGPHFNVNPYQNRYLATDCGVALVWPFANSQRGEGPYELFLDTNALNNTQWVGLLPSDVRERAILNPWPALMEQWLSNPMFRKEASSRIASMIAPLAKAGIRFRDGFAEKQTELLKKNELQLRTQASLLFPYVAIMKVLARESVGPEEALARLNKFVQAEVPRFSGSVMLIALTVLLKARQSLRLAGDKKPAYSYLESFLAFQPGKKDETDRISIPYLRNRAGDLSLWYAIPMLLQHGYPFVGEPVVVTGDKALHRVILRLLPPGVHGTGQVGFTVLNEELEQEVVSEILRIGGSVKVRQSTTLNERVNQVQELFRLAEGFCEHVEEKAALNEAWKEWCQPGFGMPMALS